MIKALNTAATGMLEAERRATDIAKEILRLSGEAASFKLDVTEASDTTSPPSAAATGAPVARSTGGNAGYSDLLQQMVDLKAEEQTFKANAKAFKRIDDTLGSLLDDKG
ncbi:hypothetical protein [Kordiimonas aestuarii]|uniref:hypothetical protein n=1 Tax=Kordiimonas aestuarii TaxID=1005925 RepID=UPI0021D24483|nr:hypothetical protein [Kordiimonas aestuarii]